MSSLRLSKIMLSFVLVIAVFGANELIMAQVDPEDPFRGNYMLGENSEIVVLEIPNSDYWNSDPRATFKFFDSNGDITSDTLTELNSQTVEEPWSIHGSWGDKQADLATADFDADGLDDVIGVWTGPDSTVTIYIPELNRSTYSWVDATRMSVQDDGFPDLFETNEGYLKGWIRMIPGQFDDDTESEFVLAYWANTGDLTGGSIQIILYDTDGTLLPKPKASIANRKLSPFIQNAGNNLLRSSRFDIATGDFDKDDTDEIVLVSVEPGPAGVNGIGWNLVSTVYDLEDDEIVEKVSSSVFQEPNALIGQLAVNTGDFNGDLYDEIALGFMQFGYILSVSSDLDSIIERSNTEIYTGSVTTLSIIAADVNLDGSDEIIFSSGYGATIYEPNDTLNIGSYVAFASANTEDNRHSHRTIALTDIDISQSDSLRMELISADYSGLLIYQNTRDDDDFNIGNQPTASYENENYNGYFHALAVGDFDGDAVRLGPPVRQTVTNITQPLVVLNAPPIHFDIIDGEIYDINECYSEDFRINCEHRAIYENANTSEMEVSTQISSDWGVSKSIEAEAGADFSFVSASVKGSLSRRYGEGFSRVEGSSETVTVKVTSDAIEDDRIYATVSNYDILEYPVYTGTEQKGSVVAVIPKLQGVESLENTWMGSKSGNARDYISDHEVGNIFSYRETANLPEGAVFFGNGGFEGGGGDTWELSATSTQTWELRFSSESISQREQSAYQQVSRSAEATVSGGYGPFRASLIASVSDQYGNEQISTHRTTVGQESALMVEFGTIDPTILGTKTYTVSPYVYWDSNGALVLDYAVSPDVSAGVPSWWEETYGNQPDLTINLPWKYDQQKGIGSTDPELQRYYL